MIGPEQIANELGLAISPLFPAGVRVPTGAHFALLDGRRASFAYSAVPLKDIAPTDSRNWQWSADLAHHVLFSENEVQVRSGGEESFRNFSRHSVETKLEDFLTYLDAGRSTLPDLVGFLIGEFQSIWSSSPGLNGVQALSLFLLAVSAAGDGEPAAITDRAWRVQASTAMGLTSELSSLEAAVPKWHEDLRIVPPRSLKLIPSLVLRHAAGRLFQDAHAIVESEQLGLFGPSKLRLSAGFSPTGAYFTPVRIARVMTEWALVDQVKQTNALSIADFACGSGVFLTEALRTLERFRFRGDVQIVGRDSSEQAITMAKVAVHNVARDLDGVQVTTDIKIASASEDSWPQADVILMNPPFRSWERMSAVEKDWVTGLVTQKGQGRPDLSVGFVELALRCLKPNGTLATMVPAGVLASDSLAAWRNSLTEQASPTLISVLGEHGLFQHALVNAGIIALKKLSELPRQIERKAHFHVAWSAPTPGSASKAIRALRRVLTSSTPFSLRDRTNTWSVNTTTLESWAERSSWLPGAGVLGALLDRIRATCVTRVEDLFIVHQGIRTGANDAFLISPEQLSQLAPPERAYFRPAITNESFVNGKLKTKQFIFFPLDSWKEDELITSVPEFYRSHLLPKKPELSRRKSLKDDRWWTLTRPRSKWLVSSTPRLISKRFGLLEAFAIDWNADYAPVQANAWLPRGLEKTGIEADSLLGYWWMLNSRVFVALLREYCPNVAGGQLDLEHKYVKHVPLPNLREKFADDPNVQEIGTGIRLKYNRHLPDLDILDLFTAAAYGTELSEWNLATYDRVNQWK